MEVLVKDFGPVPHCTDMYQKSGSLSKGLSYMVYQDLHQNPSDEVNHQKGVEWMEEGGPVRGRQAQRQLWEKQTAEAVQFRSDGPFLPKCREPLIHCKGHSSCCQEHNPSSRQNNLKPARWQEPL
ncbi:hypothetical protein Y1Q_0013199 [Alligator mississippiensis]|uniref:Uncharacterized protein n=1 Tax=Alligator mississippiensis TaxID=8496 RepID=A0A151NTX3_ALLMI|nr:hypothetical protein Y1Q_0013199 [Alligator mississippiensis]